MIYKYIIYVILFAVFIVFTIANIVMPGTASSINLLFERTSALPALIWIYIGMLFGSVITIPIMMQYKKTSGKQIVDTHMKKESKRMKKIQKKTSKRSHTDSNSNINSEDVPSGKTK